MRQPTAALLPVLLAFLIWSAAAEAAPSLDDLRAGGAIGERYDGYAVVRAQGADQHGGGRHATQQPR